MSVRDYLDRSVLAMLLPALICVGMVVAQPEVAEPDAPPAPKPKEVIVTQAPELASIWTAKAIRAVDGDTIDVQVSKIYRIRLLDCWCAETHGKQREAGMKAKFAMEAMVKDKIGVVIIPWHPEAKNELSLDRYLGRFIVNGTNVAEEMRRRKLAFKTKAELAEMYPE